MTHTHTHDKTQEDEELGIIGVVGAMGAHMMLHRALSPELQASLGRLLARQDSVARQLLARALLLQAHVNIAPCAAGVWLEHCVALITREDEGARERERQSMGTERERTWGEDGLDFRGTLHRQRLLAFLPPLSPSFA